jgi:hypothetical protein
MESVVGARGRVSSALLRGVLRAGCRHRPRLAQARGRATARGPAAALALPADLLNCTDPRAGPVAMHDTLPPLEGLDESAALRSIVEGYRHPCGRSLLPDAGPSGAGRARRGGRGRSRRCRGAESPVAHRSRLAPGLVIRVERERIYQGGLVMGARGLAAQARRQRQWVPPRGEPATRPPATANGCAASARSRASSPLGPSKDLRAHPRRRSPRFGNEGGRRRLPLHAGTTDPAR